MYLIDAAIEDIARKTPGKDADDLKRAIGVELYQTFINKTNKNCRSHELKVSELYALMLETKNPSPCHAMEAELRKAGVIGGAENVSVIDALMNKVAEGGDVVRAVHDALEDNVLSLREKKEINKQISENRAALDALEDAVNREGQRPGLSR